MHETFATLHACGCQVDFGTGGRFVYSAYALCVSGSNLGYVVDDLEIISRGNTHVL